MFPYQNPISPVQLFGTQSVSRDKTFGTNFSVLTTGGYMEVYSLDQLYYTVPPSTYGQINYSGNSIPVTFYKGSGVTFSVDTLTLNSDNISSGRKKLGMLVYVQEQDQVYQFNINNYESLWNAATGATGVGGSTVIISNFGTTVKANSPEGIAFISGWTANTIDSVSGVSRNDAVWKKYNGTNLAITGGTYSSGTLTLTNITGGTINITGFGGGGSGDSITGGTIDYNTGTLSLNSSGGTVTITGFTDTYVTGGTYNNSTGIATFTNNYGNNFTVTGFTTGGTSGTDVFVTGGTYSSGTATFTNNTGGTFNVTGFYTGNTDVFVTGGTYNKGIYDFTNNTGGTFNVSATTTYSAGVITGATWSSAGSGQINLPQIDVALFGNSAFTEPIYVYTVSSGTTGVGGIPALTDNDTNYIVIEYNSGSPQYNVLLTDATVNDSDVVLFMIVYRLGNFVHTLEFGNQGAGLPNKLNDRVIMTDRFARESGFSLGLSGTTGIITLSAGVSWNGTYRQSLAAINSFDDILFQNFHSGGTWVYTTTATTLNNLYYDDGTNPVLSSPGKFLVNWYFRGQEINDHIYELWGNDEYDSLSEAQLSTEPPLPELISSHAFLLGRIIVEYSATTGSVESSFVTVFQASQVQSHNDLTGIQGGSAGQYYHLNSNEYLNLPLLNIDNVFQSGITATTLSATTYQNYPTQTLEDTLGYGNTTGVYNIQMGSGTTINSDNGGGQIKLDNGSIPNSVYISTDSGAGNETFLNLQPTGANFGSTTHSFNVKTNESSISYGGRFTLNGTYSTYVTSDLIRSEDNGSVPISTTSNNMPGILIGSNNSTINSGVTNTVVVGGNNITAPNSNTLYSYNFNIFNTPTNNNANTEILSRNTSTGDIEYTDITILTGGTDVFVTGATYNNNTFTYTNNTGGTFNVLFNSVTGLTSTGTISSTTLSATTYQNLPISGTLDYVAKFTSSGNTIGNSQIRDDGTTIGIGLAPNVNGKLFVLTSSQTYGIASQNGLSSGVGIIGQANGLGDILGLVGLANGTGTSNIGVNGQANNATTNIGLKGYSFGGTNNYSIQLLDGTEGVGKVLTSVTSDGKANWQTLPTDIRVTGGTYSNGTAAFTNNTGGTFNVTGFVSADTFVTGVTYSANTLTISQNQGQSNLTATIGLKTKSGSVASGSFAGTPRTASVTFTTAFSNTNYSIQITGADNRTFTYQSKATTGFTINTNANSALTGNVDWVAIEHGES